jgi:glycosyltransferase involved in cell wall biosynthesis
VLHEVLSDQVTGVFAEPDSIEDWEEALRILSKDGNLRVRLGQEAQSDLSSSFTWQSRAEKIVDTFSFGF